MYILTQNHDTKRQKNSNCSRLDHSLGWGREDTREGDADVPRSGYLYVSVFPRETRIFRVTNGTYEFYTVYTFS